MKFINEKGKLFGIINIIDLCVLLAILLVAGVAGIKILGNKLEMPMTQEVSKQVLVTVKFNATNDDALDSIKTGDRLISVINPVDAYIDSIDSTTAQILVETADGKAVYANDPKKKEVTLTFKMKANPKDSIIKLGSQDVAIAKQFILKTQKVEYNARIINVSFE